jgi:hypothetical protein
MPDGRPLPPGATGLMLGKFGQISELVAGILVDPENAFVFVPSEEHRDPVALLNAQISFEVVSKWWPGLIDCLMSLGLLSKK